jgi:hypothetical protein
VRNNTINYTGTNCTKVQFIEKLISNFTAKAFWRGNGVAFKYKEKIKLMSEKLTNRQGFITFDRMLSSTDRWALTIDFSTHNVHKEHGEGMGIWLTRPNPLDTIDPKEDEGARHEESAMGMAGNLDGFGVYAKANSTERYDEDFYVLNQFSGDLTNDLFEDGAKFCRRPINGKDVINRIVLEYVDGTLTTMIKEKDGLHYCESVTHFLPKPQNFSFTISGRLT